MAHMSRLAAKGNSRGVPHSPDGGTKSGLGHSMTNGPAAPDANAQGAKAKGPRTFAFDKGTAVDCTGPGSQNIGPPYGRNVRSA